MKFSVKRHTEPDENTLTYAVLLCLVPLIPPHFNCIDHHQHLFNLCSLTSMEAKSIQEYLVQHSHSAILGFLDRRRHCLARCRIHRRPPRRPRCHLDRGSPHSSQANNQCPKCCQLLCPHHFRLDVGRFIRLGRHFKREFILQEGRLKSKLLATVIS